VKQYLTFAGNGPFQLAVAAALTDQRDWVAQLRDDLQRRRDASRSALEDSGVHTFRPSGTYFLQFDVRGFGYADADQFCREPWTAVSGLDVVHVPDPPRSSWPMLRANGLKDAAAAERQLLS
jgi:aspartate/methionine/tyrosine aminotransferase